MTREEYIEYCAEKARKEAIDVLDHYLQPFDRVKNDFRPDKKEDIEDFNLLLKSMNSRTICPTGALPYMTLWGSHSPHFTIGLRMTRMLQPL
jgi:hypothetical protein